MFQSLFYWITYSYAWIQYYSIGRCEFQSLFYWITYSYCITYCWCVNKNGLFQSLFYWITYSYFIVHVVNFIFFLSFNPYFTGLPILIIASVLPDAVGASFQSLFYWITYSYSLHLINYENYLREFQSLFYWITYSYEIDLSFS